MQTLLEEETTNEYAYKPKSKLPRPIHIPLVNDRMFKKMFYNENHKNFIAMLLSYILDDLTYEEIFQNLIFIKPTIDNQNYYDAISTVDLLVEIKNKIYNIEINNIFSKTALERNIDYANKLYSSKRKKGKKYLFDYSIQININNFQFKEDSEVIRTFYIRDNEYILTDKIKYVYISLSKIREKYYNKEKLNDLERILLILNGEKGEKLENMIKVNDVLDEYRRKAMDASEIEELWKYMSYNKEEEAEMIRQGDLYYAEEKGIKKGIKKGIAQTIKTNAINLHNNGVLDELICKSSDISQEELAKILEND